MYVPDNPPHENMAATNGSPDPDLDEGFFDSMFTSLAAPLAGSKRDAATLSGDDAKTQSQSPSQATGTGQREYPAEQVNPQALCCSHCPEVRPSKRRASAHKVGEFHRLTAESHPPIGTDQQFPDDCFEQFCQDCTFDAACPPDCNGLSNGFVNFGLHSQPTSPVTMGGISNGTMFNSQFDNSMMGFDNNSNCMLPESTFDSFPHGMGASKLDFLASAIQQEIMNPINSLTTTPSIDKTSILDPTTNTTTPAGDAAYAGCDKTFATNQAKDNHERTHTGERPHYAPTAAPTRTARSSPIAAGRT
ncbi:hypothetical protein E8E11_011177 [Didymella keratinophila]|nr:hypothetical protein E8E11_011177 [Didymella keratinophila]